MAIAAVQPLFMYWLTYHLVRWFLFRLSLSWEWKSPLYQDDIKYPTASLFHPLAILYCLCVDRIACSIIVQRSLFSIPPPPRDKDHWTTCTRNDSGLTATVSHSSVLVKLIQCKVFGCLCLLRIHKTQPNWFPVDRPTSTGQQKQIKNYFFTLHTIPNFNFRIFNLKKHLLLWLDS